MITPEQFTAAKARLSSAHAAYAAADDLCKQDFTDSRQDARDAATDEINEAENALENLYLAHRSGLSLEAVEAPKRRGPSLPPP